MKIAVIGAGLMGRAAVYDLVRADGVEQVGVFDIDPVTARQVAEKFGNGIAVSAALDAGDQSAVAAVLKDYSAAVSCVTYALNPGITKAAIEVGCHLVDLGGNNDAVSKQLDMNAEAEESGVVVIPDCGLAPGMVAILAADGISRFDKVDALKIRVGGLPQNPKPPLNYQMVFAAEGLINEYTEPCVVLENGKKKIMAPMTGLEALEFADLGSFEAFYTSGGSSTLPDTFEGVIESLDYKTIRYRGHCQLFSSMLEIGLGSRDKIEVGGESIEPRALFKAVLDRNLSFGEPDIILVRLTLTGKRNGSDKKVIYEIIDRQDTSTGLTAMMRTTAFPAAIIAWMAAAGQIEVRGVKPQEVAVKPSLFMPQLARRRINLQISEC